MKPTQLVEKKTTIQMSSTGKNVNNERVKLNQTKAKNQKMRGDVDMLRKEMSSVSSEIEGLKKNIKIAN